jgi:hypothetical protein
MHLYSCALFANKNCFREESLSLIVGSIPLMVGSTCGARFEVEEARVVIVVVGVACVPIDRRMRLREVALADIERRFL